MPSSRCCGIRCWPTGIVTVLALAIFMVTTTNASPHKQEKRHRELEDLFLALFQPTIHQESTWPGARATKRALEECARDAELPSEEELHKISKLCKKNEFFYGINPHHMSAVHALQYILRDQETPMDVICLARALRDRPEINRHVWVRAVLSTAQSRDDMSGLSRPSLMEILPSMFVNDEAIKVAKRQAGTGRCARLDGSLGADNGRENALWYWREDMMVNSHHLYWHFSNPFSFSRLEVPQKPRPDRRGELFVYLHHALLSRYHTERLTSGLGPTLPLSLTSGAAFPGHYYSHLTDANSNRTWTDRTPNMRVESLVSNRDFIRHPSNISVTDRMAQKERIERGIEAGALTDKNGQPVSLKNFNGIDVLAEVVEAGIWSINPNLYGEFGVHNDGHFLIGLAADPQDKQQTPPAVMADGATAMRDPIFYSYHMPIDDIFEKYKQTLEPYKPSGGEFQLLWPGVQVVGLQVQSLDASPPNVLKTYWNNKNLNLIRGLDFNRTDTAGAVSVCLQHLDNQAFTYQIAVTRQGTNPIQQKASVRIFLAPRVDQNNQRYRFYDQRKLFFMLDYFHVNLNPGPTLITRQSTESTLTISWPQTLEELERDVPRQTTHCGCGWPQHMLLPKGTDSGYVFDLFVMVTNADEDLAGNRRPFVNNPAGSLPSTFFGGSSSQCKPAPIFCGVNGEQYPDSKPMGYPFDRLPYTIHDPSTGSPTRMVATLDEYISGVTNMASTQVTIIHSSGGGVGGFGSFPYGPGGNGGGGRRPVRRRARGMRNSRQWPYSAYYINNGGYLDGVGVGGYA